MPTYEYACQSCGRHVEVFQKFSEDALTTCEVCGGPLRKVFHPAGILFKGSGFYATDSRKKSSSSSSGDKGGDKGGDKKKDSGEKKSESASSSSDSSSSSSSGSDSSSKGDSSSSKGDSSSSNSTEKSA